MENNSESNGNKKDINRENILKIARDIFSKYGYKKTTLDDIANAVNRVISMRGGLAVSNGSFLDSMSLPVAGIMSDDTAENTASAYERLSSAVRSMGCSMSAPFMTLSFMALLVIPELKLSDRGLFNGNIFSHVPLFCD